MPDLRAMYLLAQDLRDALRELPEAKNVCIAGSLRREKPNPHDIELCALVAPKPDLFGEDVTRPSLELKNYLITRSEKVVKAGAKYVQVIIDGITVDFFQTADPAQWGMLYFIRTGSASFVKFALTEWKRMNHWKGFCKGNILFRDYKQPVATPTEKHVFKALCWKFKPPNKRE